MSTKPKQAVDPMAPSPDNLCGARTRQGGSCGQLAMPNGRCRFHGGMSTGPRTAEGLERMRVSKITHGARTAEMRELRRTIRDLKARTRQSLKVEAGRQCINLV